MIASSTYPGTAHRRVCPSCEGTGWIYTADNHDYTYTITDTIWYESNPSWVPTETQPKKKKTKKPLVAADPDFPEIMVPQEFLLTEKLMAQPRKTPFAKSGKLPTRARRRIKHRL